MKICRVLIYMGVFFFGIRALPGLAAHPDRSIRDLQLTTELDAKTESAKLNVMAALVSIGSSSDWSQSSLALELFDPQGDSVAQTTITWFEPQKTESIGRAILPISHPHFWTAESPALYRLSAELTTPGEPTYRVSARIGIRQISTENGILSLQGIPIHLRGIVYHETHPEAELAAREESWRTDLQHMQNANINTIRVINPVIEPRFLELCDEQGFYVIPDLAFSGFEKESIDKIVSLSRNHPCIIAWSLGEHSIWNDDLARIVQSIKTLDPSRPLLIPGLTDPSLPLDILAPLNPTLEELKDLSRRKRPVIIASHALALGNALEGMEDIQQMTQEYKTLAGGMLAQFAGEGGILQMDRSPQLGFWQMRRVYSPIQMTDREMRVKPGRQSIELQIENHYDFTNLRDHSGQWFLLRDGQPILNRSLLVDLEPGKSMQLAAAFELPDDLADHDYSLQYQFSNPSKRIVFEHVVRLRSTTWQKDFLMRLRDLEWDKDWKVTADPLRAQIEHKNFSFIIQLATSGWFMRTQEHNVRLITGGPYIRTGHSILQGQENGTLSSEISPSSIIPELWADYKEMEKIEKNIELHTRFVESPEIPSATTSSEGGAQAQIDILSSPFGYCDIRFSIALNDPHPVQELGLAFLVPSTMKEVAWLGNGPSPSYPGQSLLSSWGFYRFNPLTECVSGNRSQVDLLGIRDDRGYGLGIAMIDGDFSLEPVADGTLITINAAVAGLGNGAQATGYPLSDEQLSGKISTVFRLIPLIRNHYPAMFKTLWIK